MAFSLDPKKSALIIQDLQNDVIMPGGAFTKSDGPGPVEHAQSQKVVAHAKAIAAAARAAGMPVIHVWYVVDKGAPGQLNAPLFQAVAGGASCVGPGRGAGLGLEPKRGDLIVEKMRMNAFQDTNLETLLKAWSRERRHRRLDELLDRAHGAARADVGYRAIVVTDATSTMNDEGGTPRSTTP